MQNFHIKSILLGIGIGMVLTALISTIYSAGNEPVMDKNEIIERAKQYGMVFGEEIIFNGYDEKKGSEEQQKDGNDAAKEVEATPAISSEPEEEKKASDKSEQVARQQEEVKKEVKEEEQEDVIISIEPGCTSEDLAKSLVASGLIQNEKSFVDHLVAMRLEGSIQVGDFRIKRGSDYNTIARTVTMMGR